MNIHKNILLEKERKNILNFVKSKVKDLGSEYPGLQTDEDLHKSKELLPLLNKIKKYHKNYKIDKCWANYTKGNIIAWHSHSDVDISIVYYLNNVSNLGTMFKKQDDLIEITECPQNSLLIFNSKLVHSVPIHLEEDRYSIAIDLIKI